MSNLVTYYKPFLIRMGGLLLIYSVFRFLFFVFNQSLFPDINAHQFVGVFLGGIRFDLSILIYINLVFILIWLLPFQLNKYPGVRKFQKWIFIAVNSLGLAIQSVDLVFYSFNGKRMDIEVLGLLQTLPTLAVQFFIDYWFVLFLFTGLVWGLIKLYDFPKYQDTTIGLIPRIVAFVVLSMVCVVGMRGGITNPRPLSPASATFHAQTQHLPLVTNSVYTFFYSYVHKNLDIPHYFSNTELESEYPVIKENRMFALGDSAQNKPNIVLIIMESFSKTYVGALNDGVGYTPFLDSLILNHSIFLNAFANGRRSSQGLAALTAGIPALMNEPYMYSEFLGNKVIGVPELLRRSGYSTAFFNGSSRELLGWYEYVNKVGFSSYHSRESYNNDAHHDGNWGIYDHYMFDYLLQVMDSARQPFFYTFFSLSSHHPFTIPPELKAEFSNNGSAYFNALKYADWSLGNFFKKASTKSFFKNTIFIITADHTLSGESFTDDNNKTATSMYQNRVGLYAVPLVIINPFDTLTRVIDKVVSHVDIAETIIDFANCTIPHISWGSTINSGKTENMAIQYVNGIYQIVNTEFVLLFDGHNPIALYKYKVDYTLENNLIEEPEYKALTTKMLNKLKAAIQQHHTRMVNNKLFVN